MDDLLDLADDSDRRKLEEHVVALLEVINEKLRDTTIENNIYRVWKWNEDGTILPQARENPPVARILSRIQLGEIEEAEQLREYLESEYGYIPHDRFISNMLCDAFGEHGEYLTEWDERVEKIISRIEADAANQPQLHGLILLNGIEIENDILLEEKIWLREPKDKDLFKEQLLHGTGSMGAQPLHATCAIDLTVTEDGRTQHERLMETRKLLLAAFRMYGGANVSTVATIREPVTYSLLGGRSVPNTSRPLNPKYKFNPIDVDSFTSLLDLLREFQGEGLEGFKPPIDVPLNHLDESLSRRSSPQSSISFSIIGLESLYRTYTTGNASTKDIQQYCALILREVWEDIDPIEVKDDLATAYEFRNTWAHGDRHSDVRERVIQQNLWEYLRASIVVFACLESENEIEGEALKMEDALIDEKRMDDLEDKLEGLSIMNYLPIK